MTSPFHDAVDADAELAEYSARLRDEYSKWVAVREIFHGNARAYNRGDAVPQDNAKRLGYIDRGDVVLRDEWIEEHPDDEDVIAHLERQAERERRAAERGDVVRGPSEPPVDPPPAPRDLATMEPLPTETVAEPTGKAAETRSTGRQAAKSSKTSGE